MNQPHPEAAMPRAPEVGSKPPEIGSRWIHRETLSVVTFESDTPDVFLVSLGRHPFLVTHEELHRDFIPDGPVALEALKGLGWEHPCPSTFVLRLEVSWQLRCILHASGTVELFAFDPGTSLARPLLIRCESLRDILLAMRTFGKAAP